MPEVSVIVPVYKVEPYLHQCVDSILNQTFTDFELILVDDGSPDNCGVICDEYAKRDNRVHVIHQKNGGPAAARNSGIDWVVSNSDSEWISFVDSDDWVHPNYLAYLYRAAKENNVKVSVCDFQLVKKRVEAFDLVDYHCSIDSWEGHIFNVYVFNKLYSKELFNVFRFPAGKSFEDEFLTYKLVSQYPNIAHVSCILCYYFYNNEGVSKKPFSLKNMDAVEAFSERVEYYRERGDQHVLPRCLSKYLRSICEFGEKLHRAEDIPLNERRDCEKRLKRMMRQAMLRYMPMSLRRMFLQYCFFALPGISAVTANALRENVLSTAKTVKTFLKTTPLYPAYRWFKQELNQMKIRREYHVNHRFPAESGINQTEPRERKVIISLTSFPERIPYVHKAICSMLHQTYKPDMVILWLAETQFPGKEDDLPQKLLSLHQYGLTIKWIEKDIKSYKKLIPALRAYPEDIIVTADDDVYWPSEHLSKLVHGLQERPDEIQCHRITRIHYEDGLFDATIRSQEMYGSSKYCNKLVGAGGVVYPPHCLDEEVFNEKAYLELAPTSDDIWFWAMALKRGTRIHWLEDPDVDLLYVEGTQEKTPCLCKTNDTGDRPFKQHLNAVIMRCSLAHLLEE